MAETIADRWSSDETAHVLAWINRRATEEKKGTGGGQGLGYDVEKKSEYSKGYIRVRVYLG